MSSISIQMEGAEAVIAWLDQTSKRAARATILPAMKEAWLPVAAAERAGVTDDSGALGASLTVRSGGGDRDGRYSVFIAPTATVKQAVRRWSKSSRAQQHQFAQRAQDIGKNRWRIFYGPMVEMGHKKVLWGRRTEGRVAPHPFAAPAFEQGAEQAAQQASEAVLDQILE